MCVARDCAVEKVRPQILHICPSVQRGNRKQTYLLYYMLDILFTFCVTCRNFAIVSFALVESNLNPNICDVSQSNIYVKHIPNQAV